jgi:hypothetical protein
MAFCLLSGCGAYELQHRYARNMLSTDTARLVTYQNFFCRVGEGVEPLLQGVMQSIVDSSQFAMLFTNAMSLESIRKTIKKILSWHSCIGHYYDGRGKSAVSL